jgi:hypothetical protein
MKRWAIYKSNTGQIDRVYSGPEYEALIQPQVGEQVVVILGAEDDASSYVEAGQVKARQSMLLTISSTQITANGTDEAIISNIPAGVQVEWPDGQTDIVTDGEVRFSVDLPGIYAFQFTAVPYLDKEITVEAIAAT